MKALIVDDSPQARRLLRLMLEPHAVDVEVVGEAENAAQALEMVVALKPAVIFLDIEMPGKSGIQFAEQLLEKKLEAAVVFTTAYNEYALKAFRLSAIDYLLKPIDEDHLAEAIQKLKRLHPPAQESRRLKNFVENYEAAQVQSLTIPTQSGYDFLPVNAILYVEAEGSYAKVVLSDGRQVLVSRNLKFLETSLQGLPWFVRVHRTYLANLKQMMRFEKQDRGRLIMNDGTEIELARNRRDTFFEALENLML